MTVHFLPTFKKKHPPKYLSLVPPAQSIAPPEDWAPQGPPHTWPQLDLKKPKTTAGGKRRYMLHPEKSTMAANVAYRMKAEGVVGPKPGKKPTPDEQLEQYIMLENIGTPKDVIREVMSISDHTLGLLKGRAKDLYVHAVVEDGVMGAIGVAFHRLDIASKKVLSLLPFLEGPRNSKAMVEATRALVQFEAQKIDLLVRTGAVKVKRKIEVHEQLDQTGSGDPSLMSGKAAMKILNLIETSDGIDLEPPAIQIFDTEHGSEGD